MELESVELQGLLLESLSVPADEKEPQPEPTVDEAEPPSQAREQQVVAVAESSERGENRPSESDESESTTSSSDGECAPMHVEGNKWTVIGKIKMGGKDNKINFSKDLPDAGKNK